MPDTARIYHQHIAPRLTAPQDQLPRPTGKYGFHDGAKWRWFDSPGAAVRAASDDGFIVSSGVRVVYF